MLTLSRCAALAVALALLPRPSSAQTLPPLAHRQLARAIFQELVEINTAGDSGTTRAAEALARRLRASGFPAQDIHLVGARAAKQNLVVRLRGRGKAPPILFVAHLDVVDASREDWSYDPFKLTERDGWFYGRGSADIKDEAADLIADLIRLKSEGYVPGRDIIVALTADEEGGDDNGAAWLTQHRPDLIRAAYVINTDAGGAQMQNGKRLRNPVQTSEKLYVTYQLEVTGPGGHSSLPDRHNTIYTLARALDRLSRYDFPVRLTPTIRTFFTRLADQIGGPVGSDLRAVTAPHPDSAAVERLGAVPMYNSSMRTTCVATVLQAGKVENALPQRAQATVQCRLLPGDSPIQVRDTLIRVLADTAVRITQQGDRDPAPESPLSPEVMNGVERVTRSMWPGVIVLPVMDPWSSDSRHFRLAGYPVYGVSGVFYDIDDVRNHGKDERTSVQSFYEGVEFMYQLMKELSGHRLTPGAAELATAESLYADLRTARDRIDVIVAAEKSDAPALARQVLNHNALRRQLASRLSAVDSSALSGDDARALGLMQGTLARDLDSMATPAPAGPASSPRPDCGYDAGGIAQAARGLDSLRGRIYACYGWAQFHLMLDRDTLDRLSIFGALGRAEDAARRRQLFLALAPVWRSVNGNNEPGSPYRRLIGAEVKASRSAEPAAEQARASGVPPDSLEGWLLAILTAWRAAAPDSAIEPWDWFYLTGRAGRVLSPRISRERLSALNAEVYRTLGADIGALGVRFDLDPREGKTPVAYTTFGRRPRFINRGWQPGEPWVFATYRTGGLDNLNELLHETGHAVHIAAIRTRPAFADWPDSDPFTEAVADLTALDVYEPVWQQRWLGDSVPLADGLRGRYGGIVLDVAWALFEMRMLANPAADPNAVWTELTSNYLRIRPHPELSWWAMRGQLVDSPGYMMNYAVGAILSAAIRARVRASHGTFASGDSTWYAWIAPRLFRFGLERPTREVLEDFLGGPVSPAPLLEDMRRMAGY